MDGEKRNKNKQNFKEIEMSAKWFVNVLGKEKIEDEKILDFFYTGIFSKPKLDNLEVYNFCIYLSSLESLDQIIWRNVNYYNDSFTQIVFKNVPKSFLFVTHFEFDLTCNIDHFLEQCSLLKTLKLFMTSDQLQFFPSISLPHLEEFSLELILFTTVNDKMIGFFEKNTFTKFSVLLVPLSSESFQEAGNAGQILRPIIDILKKKRELYNFSSSSESNLLFPFSDVIIENKNIKKLSLPNTYDKVVVETILKSQVTHLHLTSVEQKSLNDLAKSKTLRKITWGGVGIIKPRVENFLSNTMVIDLPTSKQNGIRNFIIQRNKKIWRNIGLSCGTLKIINRNNKSCVLGQLPFDIVKIICVFIQETHSEVLIWTEIFH